MKSFKSFGFTLFFLFFFFFLISPEAFAGLDSAGVFHRPEKVIVLISENGEGERLQTMMNYFEVGEVMSMSSADNSITILCRRKINTASCTFSFLPGRNTVIGARTLDAAVSLYELGATIIEDFDMSFESSLKDKFNMIVINGHINFYASKKR